MPATLIAKTAGPASSAGPEAPVRRETAEVVSNDRHETHPHAVRVHVSNVVVGLIDAHFSGIDFFDTPGGDELWRWYEARRVSRRDARKHHTSSAA